MTDNRTTELMQGAEGGGRMIEITVDMVRDLIEQHSDHISGNTREFYNGAYAEIADELNSRAERTCEFNIKDNMNETEGMGDVWIECSACHCVFDFYADEWLMKMSYCPNCGRKCI